MRGEFGCLARRYLPREWVSLEPMPPLGSIGLSVLSTQALRSCVARKATSTGVEATERIRTASVGCMVHCSTS